MKRFDKYFLVFIAIKCYTFGAIISNVGEIEPEHKIEYSTAFLFVILFSVPFLLGYFSGRDSK